MTQDNFFPNEPAIWAELHRVPHLCFTRYKELRPVLFRSGSSLFLMAQSVSLLDFLGSGSYFPNFRINTSFLRAKRALHHPDSKKTSHIVFQCKCYSGIMPNEWHSWGCATGMFIAPLLLFTSFFCGHTGECVCIYVCNPWLYSSSNTGI